MQLFKPSQDKDIEKGDAPIFRALTFRFHAPSNPESSGLRWKWLQSKESQVPSTTPTLSSQPSSSKSASDSCSGALTSSTSVTQISLPPSDGKLQCLKLAENVRAFPAIAVPAPIELEWESKLFRRVQHECAQRIPDGRFSLHLWMSDIDGRGMKPCVVYVAHLSVAHRLDPIRGLLLKKIERKLRKLESLRLQDYTLLVHAGPACLKGSPLDGSWPGTAIPSNGLGSPLTRTLQRSPADEAAQGQRLKAVENSSHMGTEVDADAYGHCTDIRVHACNDGALETYTALPILFSGSTTGRSTVGGLVVIDSRPYALTTSHALVTPIQGGGTEAFSSLLADSTSLAGDEDDTPPEQSDSSSPQKCSDAKCTIGTTAEPSFDDDVKQDTSVRANTRASATMTLDDVPYSSPDIHRVIGTVYTNHNSEQTETSISSDWALITLVEGEQCLPNTYIDPETSEIIAIESTIDTAKGPPLTGTKALILAGRSGIQRAEIGRVESKALIDGITMKVIQLLLEVPLGELDLDIRNLLSTWCRLTRV